LTQDRRLILLITNMSEFNVNVLHAIIDLSRLDEIQGTLIVNKK